MASKNAETIRGFFDVKNEKDFDAQVNHYREDAVFRDHSLGEAFQGREAIKANSTAWNRPFSDHHATDLRIHDASDTVVVQLVFEGTHDGPLGPYEPSGSKITMPTCFIFQFDPDGRIVAGDVYYCKLRLLEQLGFAEEVATHPQGQGPDLPY